MYKLDLPIDLKEAAAIERRRNREQQRQSRIFNAKTRTIGIDLQAVEQQIQEKKAQELREKQRSEAFAADAVRNDKIATLLAERQEADRRELNKAEIEFRMLHQQAESRREFDLYDPEARRKDKPARACDDDPRCGVSGMQKFEGEDLNSKARQKYMNEQSDEWHKQQIANKKRDEAALEEANRLYDLKRRELDERAMALAAAEEDCRKAIDCATAEYNSALKREMEERERLRKQQEQDDNNTEIRNMVYSDMLTENPAVAMSAFGPGRVVPDRWKGMSPEQLEEIKRLQQLQMEEADRMKQEDARREAEWDRQRVAQARAAMLMERELERKEAELKKQQAEDNLRLAREQKEYNNHLQTEVYTNPPTAAYFMQFNTTTR